MRISTQIKRMLRRVVSSSLVNTGAFASQHPASQQSFRRKSEHGTFADSTWLIHLTTLLIVCSLAMVLPRSASAATAAGTVISNQAQVDFTVGAVNLAISSNTDTVTVQALPPDTATAAISYSPSIVHPGDAITLDITLDNIGSNDLIGGELQLTPPTGSTLTASGGITVTQAGDTFTLTLPDITVGNNLNFQTTVTLPMSVPNGANVVPVDYSANSVPVVNTSVSLNVTPRTTADIKAWQYDTSAATTTSIPVTQYYDGSSYVDISAPTVPGTGQLVTDAPLPLSAVTMVHKDQTLFFSIDDNDQNRDPAAIETVIATIEAHQSSGSIGDTEILKLKETSANSGVFVGYIKMQEHAAVSYDGDLSVTTNSSIHLLYDDNVDTSDAADYTVLVDPYGLVFDSNTGAPVNGVTVSFIDADTGTAATVYGDDGVSIYPSTVVTGSTVTDSGGTVYDFPDGNFRFPFSTTGNYRLVITLPANSGYSWPSTATDSQIQSLPGAPFTIDTGSRGETFALQAGPPLRLDIPLDPIATPLFVTKTASKDAAAAGDFVQYRVTVENTLTLNPANNVVLTDILPHGFRYRKGSARIDDVVVADPTTAADGRTLSFSLGNIAPETTVTVTYVAQVGAAPPGDAINVASALGNNGVNSNTASVTVKITEDLMRSRGILLGRVALDEAGRESSADNSGGVANVRVYLEDGSYVLTDERGMYHFEGLKPGTHVVQLDVDSLPEQYEVISAGENTRFAGRMWSQFVDLQGGSLWRADFKVKLKPRATGNVTLRMESELADSRTQHYRFDIGNTGVPLRNTRLVMMLPDNVEYLPDSARLGDNKLPDPEINTNMLTFRLGDLPPAENLELAFDARSSNTVTTELLSKATVIFDSPTGLNQRTPVAESTLSVIKTEAIVSQSVVTMGLRPGETWTLPKAEAKYGKPDGPKYDKAWIETATPGFELLFPLPTDRPSIPAIHVGIKHSPLETVELFLNGKPVDKMFYERTIKNKAGTVAFSLWRGVHIIEGDNELEIVTRNRIGEETGRLLQNVHYSGPPVRAELVESQSVLTADGITNPVIAVRLFDKDNHPVREDAGGEYHINPPYAPVESTEFSTEVMPGAPTERHRYLVGADGIAKITLQPTTEADDVVITLPLMNGDYELTAALKSKPRDWILVGLAEGTIGSNNLDGAIQPLTGTAAEENLYKEGRIAFYAKGQVKGEWLLTVAYDSDKEKTNSLKQVIDPGTYYTLYGDTSSQRYDAASGEKLYLKIERDDFYAVYGDFDTGLNANELSKYNRSMTGLKSKYRDDRYEVIVFASESDQGFIKDEIRGKGITGPYQLSRRNIVLNSEKVTIQVRDRFRSEVIVTEQVLSRHVDYDINYDKGTLLFRTPISSTDSKLNHTFIVVDYESWDQVNRSSTYGGRAAMKVTAPLEVGITHITEGLIGDEKQLNGTDITYKFSPDTRATVEYAKTDNITNNSNTNDDAYLAEVEHRSNKLDARVYHREQGEDFGLGQQNGSETGTRKSGAEASYHVTDNVDLQSQAYRQTNLATDAKQDLIEAETRYQHRNTALRGGVRSARDTLATGETQSSDLVTAGVTQAMMDGRLSLRLDQEQAIGGKDQSTDFPSLTRLGADYLLTDRTSLFAEQEWTDGADRETEQSRVGMITRPWAGSEISTALKQTQDVESERTSADIGVRQQWTITERWSADIAMERSETLRNTTTAPLNVNVPPAHGLDEDSSAASLGVTYHPGDWLWNIRADYRDSTSEDNRGLFTSVQTQPHADLGALLSLSLVERQTLAGAKSLDTNIRLGLAYRPDESRWLLLNKLDWIQERNSGDGFDFNNWRIVNNLNANYRHNHKWQSSIQYGAKYVTERIDGIDYDGYTDLVGYETRYDFTPRWDVGVRISALHAWEFDQYDYLAGASIGHSFVDNVWVSVGYNVTGFSDKDFSAADYTSQGPFVKFRIKFDQQSIKDVIRHLDR